MNNVKIKFSYHAMEQIQLRKLKKSDIESVIKNPDRILKFNNEVVIYHKIVFEGEKAYLYRVFVNIGKEPNLVITAYKTSKIEKYEN